MAVRGDGKISWRDLTNKSIFPGSHLVSALAAQGQMANAIEDGERKEFEDAAKEFIVETVKAEFDPDNGVTLRILDPENDFGFSSGEVLELVRNCFYRPPANLQIQVRRVRFGFLVIISLSH